MGVHSCNSHSKLMWNNKSFFFYAFLVITLASKILYIIAAATAYSFTGGFFKLLMWTGDLWSLDIFQAFANKSEYYYIQPWAMNNYKVLDLFFFIPIVALLLPYHENQSNRFLCNMYPCFRLYCLIKPLLMLGKFSGIREDDPS